MAEVADLIQKIDVTGKENGISNTVRIIQLQHNQAQAIVNVIQQAILSAAGTTTGVGGGPGGALPGGTFGAGTPFGGAGGVAPGGANAARPGQRAAVINFLTVDAKGKRLLTSGILDRVTITADPVANAVVINSPAENIDLLEALVRELDNLPAAEAQIKVFRIINGDATNLSNMLRTLFGERPRPLPAAAARVRAASAAAPAAAPSRASFPRWPSSAAKLPWCRSASALTRGPTA